MEGFRTHKDLFVILRNNKRDMNDYLYLYEEILKKVHISSKDVEKLKICLRKFTFKLKEKWRYSGYTERPFLKRNNVWLQKDVIYPSTMLHKIPSTSTAAQPNLCTVSVYKGKKALSECSRRERIRRARSLADNFSLDELLNAAKLSLWKRGMHQRALSLRLQNYECDHNKHINKRKMFTAEKALSIFVMANLSKFQYITIRNEAIKCNNNQWPSYFKLLQEKNNCYPPKDEIEISNTYTKIKLQSLLNHTVSRILKSLTKTIDNTDLELICKWGCDGASGLPRYKQSECLDDDAIFVSSLVPLRLQTKLNHHIIWENPTPSSPWFCRPIRFQYIKENKEVIEEEINSIRNEIKDLTTFNINNNKIEYTMALTMVDNKVCNAITNTASSMRCYICGATPTQTNNLKLMNSKIYNSSNLSFGISTLHAWIRCLECLLHISYNLSFKKWTANTDDLKKQRKEKKEQIQKEFKEKMGLYVDHVKQGWGSSNDGNTARRFFSNPQLSSQITGIDEKLIKKFHIILQVISSAYKIDIEKFQQYTQDTAKYYVQNYGWYYMPPSVHKLLIHGADIIQHALLPIGQLSEEALEARHKDFKQIRIKNTRKCSRTETNKDILYRLLLTSDPYMSTIRIKSSTKKTKELDPEALELIMK